MSEELMLLTNGTEKESPKPNHYVDDPSFIREEETPEAREKQFKEMQRSMRPGYVRLRSMEEISDLSLLMLCKKCETPKNKAHIMRITTLSAR